MAQSAALPTSVNPLGRIIELDVFSDDLAERLIGLRRLQAAVEVDRGLDIAVAKQPLDGFVVAGMVLEIDRRTGMAELVHGHPHAGSLLDALRNLGAEHVCRLGLTGDAREQPGRVRAAHQRRPELVNVFIDQGRQGLVELKFEIDPVLDVIVREDQPERRVRTTGLDQVLAQFDGDQVGQADRRKGQDGDGATFSAPPKKNEPRWLPASLCPLNFRSLRQRWRHLASNSLRAAHTAAFGP
jgi:hypothetical protein